MRAVSERGKCWKSNWLVLFFHESRSEISIQFKTEKFRHNNVGENRMWRFRCFQNVNVWCFCTNNLLCCYQSWAGLQVFLKCSNPFKVHQALLRCSKHSNASMLDMTKPFEQVLKASSLKCYGRGLCPGLNIMYLLLVLDTYW